MNVVAPLFDVHLLELPVRLAAKSQQHFEELMREFTLTEQRLADAIDRGDAVIDDHVVAVPREAGPASQRLGDLLDEADGYAARRPPPAGMTGTPSNDDDVSPDTCSRA